MGIIIRRKRKVALHKGRERKARPKTFASREKAEAYAKAQKLAKYKVVALRQGLSKKFRVVAE